MAEFSKITELEKRSEPALHFIFKTWQSLLLNNSEQVSNFELENLKDRMLDLAVYFYDHLRQDVKNCIVEWNEFYVNEFHSVLIKSKNGRSFLFPFDLVRFSSFRPFVKKVFQEMQLLLVLSDEDISLSLFVDKIPSIASECTPDFSRSELQLMEASVSIPLTGEGRKDLQLIDDATEKTRWKKQIRDKLSALGVLNITTRINYFALGLIPYLVYHEHYLSLPWTDFIYLEIACERNMKATLVFIPKQRENKILLQMKNLGRFSPLEKAGSNYSFSLFNKDSGNWEIDVKEIFLVNRNKEPNSLDFTTLERTEIMEPITNQLIEIVNLVSKVEYMKARELAEITGMTYSKVTYWFRKIVDASLVKAQVVLKYIALPYIYHLLLERDGNEDLIAALHQFPKVSAYRFRDLYLFLLYLSKEAIFDMENFIDDYQKSGKFSVLSKGTIVLGDTLKYKNLDFNRIWDKKKKNWNFN